MNEMDSFPLGPHPAAVHGWGPTRTPKPNSSGARQSQPAPTTSPLVEIASVSFHHNIKTWI